MSFINLLLSRKEVVVSLAVVGLILLLALMLAITPPLIKSWKRMQAQRKARKAAKLAWTQKMQAAKRARQLTAEASEVEVTDAPLPEVEAVAPEAETVPATVAPFEVEAEEEEEEVEETDPANELQGLLDDVFVDDEVGAHYKMLLQDLEIPSAEDLVSMATKVAADLREASRKLA